MKPPLKHWGQHFLHDQTVVAQILKAIAPRPTDTVIEVGAGRGALTQALLSKVEHLDAIEIDPDLANHLESNFGKKLTVHRMNVLDFDFQSFQPQKRLCIVGNLPYNISTPLLLRLFEFPTRIHTMHFMLQREVAQRLMAQPGEKCYSRLSVIAQCFSQTQQWFEVPPQAFHPQPKVDSAFVRIQPQPVPPQLQDERDRKLFFDIVRQGFAQRRKMLNHAYRGMFNAATLEEMGIDPKARGETLTLQNFLSMLEYTCHERRSA